MKLAHHSFLAGAASMLGGSAATLLVPGGWEAVAVAVAMLGGSIFVLAFIALQVAGERPMRDRTAPPRRLAAAPARRTVPAADAARRDPSLPAAVRFKSPGRRPWTTPQIPSS